MKRFVVYGDYYDCDEKRNLRILKNHYCLVEDGLIKSISETNPDSSAKLVDYSGKIIIPGLIDLHMHAPQYGFRGLGMDMELLDWLDTYTFPEESKYSDIEYAKKQYAIFVDHLKNSWTTRASIFGTIYTDSTLLLMDLLEKSGLISCVGKVNMDRNSKDYYQEETSESISETLRFIEQSKRFSRTYPIITPRFIPSCSDELMSGLGKIQDETLLPIQSHLSENRSEIEWVKELSPDSQTYGDAYDKYGLFGKNDKTIMAHCVSSTKTELDLIRVSGVYVAHCPSSNMNLSSGIAPVRKMLEKGIRVGLGTDVAAGESLSMPHEMVRAVQASKIRWRYVNSLETPINMMDAFYMATRVGGSFFGEVGCFEKDYQFDAIVIDDSSALTSTTIKDEARLERAFYLAHECKLVGKYVFGEEIDIK